MARVAIALPPRLRMAVAEVLGGKGTLMLDHEDPVGAAECAADDREVVALIGPYRSSEVAEALEVTAPAGLALLAPAATWSGLTHDDEPGAEDPARSDGTLFRLVARDTVVAQRIAAEARSSGAKALVIAGRHDYGRQLDAQLRLAGLPRATSPAEATLVVLCGLAGEPETERAARIDLPLVAFDGVQGADLGDREAFVAMPYAPVESLAHEDVLAGVGTARRAGALLLQAFSEIDHVAVSRPNVLAKLREHPAFDGHGDPVDPPVSLWRAGPDWVLEPHRPLAG